MKIQQWKIKQSAWEQIVDFWIVFKSFLTIKWRSKMKTVAYFIGLKTLEISGAFIGYYLLCKLYVILIDRIYPTTSNDPFWLGGLIVAALGLFSVLVVAILCLIVSANWEKAKELANKGGVK